MAIPGNNKTFHLACMDGDTAAVQVIGWGVPLNKPISTIYVLRAASNLTYY